MMQIEWLTSLNNPEYCTQDHGTSKCFVLYIEIIWEVERVETPLYSQILITSSLDKVLVPVKFFTSAWNGFILYLMCTNIY